jgi:hypothetical protein
MATPRVSMAHDQPPGIPECAAISTWAMPPKGRSGARSFANRRSGNAVPRTRRQCSAGAWDKCRSALLGTQARRANTRPIARIRQPRGHPGSIPLSPLDVSDWRVLGRGDSTASTASSKCRYTMHATARGAAPWRQRCEGSRRRRSCPGRASRPSVGPPLITRSRSDRR